MTIDTQLLCTFTSTPDLELMVETIDKSYTLIFNKIYVLQNIEDPDQLVLTYNVERSEFSSINAPISTISVHRKKQTNTIYTINAINKLIEFKNNGVVDKNYKIDWEELKNCVLVTAYNKLKVVNTKLLNIIEI